MAVTILERVYTHIERPLDQDIDWCMGNVGVWQKLRLRCEFQAAIKFDTTNSLFMEEPNIFTLNNGSNWFDNGFDVGDFFVMKWTTVNLNTGAATVSQVTGTIVQINGSTFYSSNSTGLGAGAAQSNIYPAQFANSKIYNAVIVTAKKPQGIRFKYAHTTNTLVDSLSFASLIDGTISEFLADGTDVMGIGTSKQFTFLSLQSGMSIKTCTLKYIASQGGTVAQQKHIYDIEIVFMLVPLFEDVTTFEDNEPPPQYLDTESVTDAFLITGYPVYNNPNIKIENDPNVTKRLGNSGWFDENFNGFANPFTVSSIDFFNAGGTSVVALDYQNPITLRAVIDDIPNVSSQTKCTYGFQWIPTEATDYKSKLPQAYKNFKVNTGGTATSFDDVFNVSNIVSPTLRVGYASDGATMDTRNIRFQQTGTNQITFECEFVPSAAFSAFMEARNENERNYILWVNVGDQNEIYNQSDRVTLLLQYATLQTYVEPIGEYAGMSIGFLDHTQDENDTPNICGVDIRIEDDILGKITFQVDTAVSSTIPIPTALNYGILLQRDSDGFQYLLDRYAIDLTQYPSVTQYNFNASRGFKLGAGNSKNKVGANYFAALDSGTLKGVLGLYGFKVRWEDWLSRNDAPLEVRTAFFDNTLNQNGLNNDWYRYLNTLGWSVNFYVYTLANLNGQAVRYVNLKQMVFQDYNANADITTTFTYYRDSDNTVLSGGTDPISGLPLGVILSNELVRLEILWTRGVGTWASVAEAYGINTIEVRDGSGQFEYRQLSSIWLPENDNPLLPLLGDTLLNMVLVSPTEIKASCLIDPTKLIPSNNFKITGRIGCN